MTNRKGRRARPNQAPKSRLQRARVRRARVRRGARPPLRRSSGVYHYTSNEGAIGIINSGCLFATNYKYLNDARELALTRGIVVPIFEKEFREGAERLVREKKLDPRYKDRSGEQTHREEAEKFFDIAMRVTDDLTPVFITSFCRHEEGGPQATNGLLSQWRGYGSRGGCALEFDEPLLDTLIEKERVEGAFSYIALQDVRYHDHKKAFPSVEGVAMTVMLHFGGHVPEAEVHRQNQRVYQLLATTSPALKDNAWEEEKEVRIVALAMNKEAHAEAAYAQRRRPPVFMRFREGMPIPTIKLLEQPGATPLPIKRIIVGPQRDQGKVVYALGRVLHERGLNIPITMSSISYIPG